MEQPPHAGGPTLTREIKCDWLGERKGVGESGCSALHGQRVWLKW